MVNINILGWILTTLEGCAIQQQQNNDLSSLNKQECLKKCSEILDCYAVKWGGECNILKLNEKDKCNVDISSKEDWVLIKTHKCMLLIQLLIELIELIVR